MKVLFVSEVLGLMGGVEQNVADAAEGLGARGHECTLAYGKTGFDSDDYRAHFAATVRCREMSDSPVDPTSELFASIVQRISPDVIYFHKVSDMAFSEPFFGRIPTVRMVHDHDLCCPRRHKYFALSGRVCNNPMGWRCWMDAGFVARDPSSVTGLKLVSIKRKKRELRRNGRLDRVIVGSRFMRDELLMNWISGGRVSIIPPVARVSRGAPTPVPASRHVLYVGQLIRGKGVDLLLRALREIAGDWTATIAGSGNAEQDLRRVCHDLGLEGRVQFVGWKTRDELTELYRSARIVVVPSRWPEPFGMVGVEAMFHGRPVVGFDVGGIRDWLEHERTGLLVPAQNIHALADAIQRLLSDHLSASALGRAGRLAAETRFPFAGYLDALERLLYAVCQDQAGVAASVI